MSARPLTKEEMAEARAHAAKVLKELELDETPATSWVRGEDVQSNSFFDRHGFLLVNQMCDSHQVTSLVEEMTDLVNRDWDPAVVNSFSTNDNQIKQRGDYFLESASRIHFFAEPAALDDNGQLAPKFKQDKTKIDALNKAGHALHRQPPGSAFRSYTHSEKMSRLVRDTLGWQDPVVPQSMYIFKQPQVGGTVNSHQDSTFLFTTPRQSCLGLWLALDNATLENGCLWVRPGSHREKVRRQFVRNPDYFGEDAIAQRSNVPLMGKTETETPKLIFRQLEEELSWDGKLPEEDEGKSSSAALLQAGFIPVECKAGDLLAFTGTLDHLSLPNFSDKARHTFQLHLVEGPSAGVTWSESNWLQYPSGTAFVSL